MPRNTMITEAQFLEIAKFILETREKYPEIDISGADVFGYLGNIGKAAAVGASGKIALGSDKKVKPPESTLPGLIDQILIH